MLKDPILDSLIDSFETGRTAGMTLARFAHGVTLIIGRGAGNQFWSDGFEEGGVDDTIDVIEHRLVH
ncbi:hypothetical protein ACFOKI_05655 [Sphingomonas qilianensis]|uniref:Uncharacterized protein n=1 Tax=Sphingomonas qilianensis TaxID=1736690 RepID=A0ABU9XRK0_9SPHN